MFIGECCNYFCFLDGTPWIPGDKWLVRAGAGVWEEAAAATGHGNIGRLSPGTLARPGSQLSGSREKQHRGSPEWDVNWVQRLSEEEKATEEGGPCSDSATN